jgi:hypothetical protein
LIHVKDDGQECPDRRDFFASSLEAKAWHFSDRAAFNVTRRAAILNISLSFAVQRCGGQQGLVCACGLQ